MSWNTNTSVWLAASAGGGRPSAAASLACAGSGGSHSAPRARNRSGLVGMRHAFLGQPVGVLAWLERAQQPVGAARSVGRMFGGAAAAAQPSLVGLVRLAGVDGDVAVGVAVGGGPHVDRLVPAVLPGDG